MHGVYKGTVMAFGAATLYMLVYFYVMNKHNKKIVTNAGMDAR